MGIVNKLLEWCHKKVDKLTCKIHGHQGLTLIEEYSRKKRLKIFKNNNLKKLSMCPVKMEYLIWGKIKCGTCGCVFIGNIVKVKENEHFYRRA